MRRSVERFGPQHKEEMIMVSPSVGFYACQDFEARRFAFMESFLRTHAVVFPRNEFPSNFPRFPPAGRCFDNAFELSILCDLTYCEGVIVAQTASGPFYLPHAWCCSQDGSVVDPTAYRVQAHPGITYVGIPFNKSYVWSWWRAYGFHGMLDGHPDLGDSVGVYKDHSALWLFSLTTDLPRWSYD